MNAESLFDIYLELYLLKNELKSLIKFDPSLNHN